MADTSQVMSQGAHSSRMSYRPAGSYDSQDNFMSPDVTALDRNPMIIQQAICNYRQDATSYFLVVVSANDSVEYFGGPEYITQKDIGKIFNLNKFFHSQRPRGADSSKGRKTAGSRKKHREDTSPICIGDDKRVWEFYIQRFEDVQQHVCKLIAKAWVKAMAPKKQSTHPYTGDQIPDWWPKPSGSRDLCVRHKEPDHLKKHERLYLLAHILRLIIEPNDNQHPAIKRLNLCVSKLEKITNDSLTDFFAENNDETKEYHLKEMFKVARTEEQYKKGEICGDTEVQLMPADRLPMAYDDKDEDGYSAENTLNSSSHLSTAILGQDSAPALAGPTATPAVHPQTPHCSQAAMATPLGPNHPTPIEMNVEMQGHYGSGRWPSVYNVSGPKYTTGGPQVPRYSSNTSAGPSWQQRTTAGSPPLFSFADNAQLPLPLPHIQPEAETQGNPAHYVPHMDVQYGQYYSVPKY
ncbi:Protein of unknown function (DUF2841) domain containing protein [Rhypophila sp. PSN 637]